MLCCNRCVYTEKIETKFVPSLHHEKLDVNVVKKNCKSLKTVKQVKGTEVAFLTDNSHKLSQV